MPAAYPSTALTHGAVHVWTLRLDVGADRLARLARLLSSDERDRAAQFRRKLHADRYVAGRGQVRELLGWYSGVTPAAVAFDYDVNKKPSLSPGHGRDVVFNLAHSDDVGLFAVANARDLGVDVERVRDLPDMRAVAMQFFSQRERDELAALAPSEYAHAFYRCWTRKEAYLKAVGTGLMTPLDSFDVAVHGAPRLLRVAGDVAAPQRWTFAELTPATGFIGVLATDRPIESIRSTFYDN